jgi:hypothetical protein
MNTVTFGEFRLLAGARQRTVDDLVELFRGKIEDPRDFFERVMSCQWRNPETRRYEDRSNVVIAYRSVLEFYAKEKSYLGEEQLGKVKRQRGPQSEEHKEASLRNLEKARAAKSGTKQNRPI